MSDTHGTYRRVSVLDAAHILGVSPTTVRRMIKAGALQVERAIRPQGHTFLVLLPPDIQPDAATRHQVSAEARTEVPPSDAMAALIQATLAPIVAPLVAEQAALRQVVERQADRIADLARENGTLTERLAAQKRLREAAMAHAAELERRIEAAARLPEPAPDPSPAPPKPNIGTAGEIADLRAEHDRHTAELERADAMLARQVAEQATISRQVRRLQVALAVAVTLALVVLAAAVATGPGRGW